MVENRLGEPLSTSRARCRARGTPTPSTTQRELAAVFARSWVGVGSRRRRRRTRFVPGDARRADCPCSSCAIARARCARSSTCAATAVRRSPTGCGNASALSCPYHALGLPARRVVGAIGRGRRTRRGSIPTTTACSPSRSRRSPGRSSSTSIPTRAAVRSRPLGAALDPYRLDELELGERTAYDCAFNWKVLLENYCENYHTPFVHSQLPNTGYEYPIETEGPVVFAWDRPLAPRDASERALHDCRPGRRRAGRPSPTSPPPSRSTTAATSRCSRTPRSRASPASRRRSG